MKFTIGVLITCMALAGCSTPDAHPSETITSESMTVENTTIRYVALGDSYTIGQGVTETERWPNLLVQHLQAEGVNIELVANPARTGWTTQQVIDVELPIMRDEQANFVTLQIGVNDYIQGVSADQFQKNITVILDTALAHVGNPQHITVITIPDFGVTPAAPMFGNPTAISAGITEFNTILQQAAAERSIPVADIFTLSQGMVPGSNLLLADGIHPSAQEYTLWEAVIYTTVQTQLKTYTE